MDTALSERDDASPSACCEGYALTDERVAHSIRHDSAPASGAAIARIAAVEDARRDA